MGRLLGDRVAEPIFEGGHVGSFACAADFVVVNHDSVQYPPRLSVLSEDGIRRIEAVAGPAVLAYLNERDAVVRQLGERFKAQPGEIVELAKTRVRPLAPKLRKARKTRRQIVALPVSEIRRIARELEAGKGPPLGREAHQRGPKPAIQSALHDPKERLICPPPAGLATFGPEGSPPNGIAPAAPVVGRFQFTTPARMRFRN